MQDFHQKPVPMDIQEQVTALKAELIHHYVQIASIHEFAYITLLVELRYTYTFLPLIAHPFIESLETELVPIVANTQLIEVYPFAFISLVRSTVATPSTKEKSL